MTEYKVDKKIEIIAGKNKVWDVLTNPSIIKQYLFGTEVISGWSAGSDIVFKGEYNGVKYRDKGKILVFDKEKTFSYSYWSSFSGLEDKEENYSVVTYNIDEKNGITVLYLSQENIATTQAAEHSDKNWGLVLDALKNIAEHSD